MIARSFSLILLCSLLVACNTIGTGNTQFDRRDPRRGYVTQHANTIPLGVRASGPIMLRLFKEEHELELWRQNIVGSWTKAKTYSICRYSGVLGPKTKMADYQAPEGFYTITSGQLNSRSREYLSINTGYPNAYDRAHGYTGSDVMLHGGCKSAGCFAMTDEYMEEIYAAVRDAIQGGQRQVQLQIYPFRMDDDRMLAVSDHLQRKFWAQLKVGYDYGERYQRPVPMGVSAGRYVLLDTR